MKGWVYVISTETHDLLKIGFTERDPKTRAKELDGTSAPHPHIVEYAVLVESPFELEQSVHRALVGCRENKEWFKCTVTLAANTIKDIAGESILLEDAHFRNILKFADEKTKLQAFKAGTEELLAQRDGLISSHKVVHELKYDGENLTIFSNPFRLFNITVAVTVVLIFSAFLTGFYKMSGLVFVFISVLFAIPITRYLNVSDLRDMKQSIRNSQPLYEEKLAKYDHVIQVLANEIWPGISVNTESLWLKAEELRNSDTVAPD